MMGKVLCWCVRFTHHPPTSGRNSLPLTTDVTFCTTHQAGSCCWSEVTNLECISCLNPPSNWKTTKIRKWGSNHYETKKMALTLMKSLSSILSTWNTLWIVSRISSRLLGWMYGISISKTSTSLPIDTGFWVSLSICLIIYEKWAVSMIPI